MNILFKKKLKQSLFFTIGYSTWMYNIGHQKNDDFELMIRG